MKTNTPTPHNFMTYKNEPRPNWGTGKPEALRLQDREMVILQDTHGRDRARSIVGYIPTMPRDWTIKRCTATTQDSANDFLTQWYTLPKPANAGMFNAIN